MNKWVYIIFYPIFALLGFIMVLMLDFWPEELNIVVDLFFLALTFFGIVFLMASTIVQCVFTYKMWAAIQDEHTKITPGKAVGYLFIPFYNLYWIFRVYHNYVDDFNRYIEKYAIKTEKLSEGIFLAYAITSIIAWPINLFIAIPMISKVADGVNAIKSA